MVTWVEGLVQTTLEKFENKTIFLWLGLPSTLIIIKQSFLKIRLELEKYENAGFAFLCGRKTFLKMKLLENEDFTTSCDFPV